MSTNFSEFIQWISYQSNQVLTDTWVVVKQISQFASVDAEDDLVLTYSPNTQLLLAELWNKIHIN